MLSIKFNNRNILSHLSLTALLVYSGTALSVHASENQQIASSSPPSTESNQAEGQTPPCHDRKTVIVSGLDLLSKEAQKKIMDRIPLCLEQKNLNAISKWMTASFAREGYFHIHLKDQSSLSNENVQLDIEPVRIADIVGASQTMNPNVIFPGYKAHPYLYLSDLEEGLDQLNRLSSNHVEIDIESVSEGMVLIKMKNQDKSRFHGSLGFTNTGEKITGKVVTQASVSLDSPFGLSDFISAGGSRSSGMESISTSYNMPYGYWLLSGTASDTDKKYRSPFATTSGQRRALTHYVAIQLERVLERNKASITSLSGQLSRANVQKTLDGAMNEAQSPVITKSLLGIHHTALFGNASLKTDLEWQRGLEQLNATRDLPTKDSDDPHAQFNKFLLSGNWSGSFTVDHRTLNYEHQFFGQYATHALYGREQLSISDAPYIRGMSDWDISGDTGFVFHHTLSMPLPSSSVHLTPRIGFDIGQVWNSGHHHDKLFARSASIGMTIRAKNMVLDVDYAKGNTTSDTCGVHHLFASGTWSF